MSARSACVFVAALVVACCAPASVFARSPRVTVLAFKGQMAVRAHDAVTAAFDEAGGYELVSSKEVTRTAESLGVDVSEPAGRVAVARELQIAAYVTGTVSKRGANFEVQLTAYSGSSGEALGVATLRAKKPALQRVVRGQALDEIGPLLARAEAPEAAEPEPTPVEKAEPEPEPEPTPREESTEPDKSDAEEEAEPEDNGPRPKAFELDIGLRLLARDMSYNQPVLELGEQSSTITPTAALGLLWYPGAHFSSGAAAHVGLEASGQLTYPIESKRDADSFKTSSHAFGVGLHGRLPVGEHELGLSVGYGQHAVEIADSDDGVDPGVPSVKYGFLRFVLNARFQLGTDLGLRLGAGYRLLLGYGELAEDEWFKRTGGGAIEAEIGLRYTLTGPLALEAIFGMWRYGLSLKPDPADASVTDFARVAGGITDQYLFGGLAAVIEL